MTLGAAEIPYLILAGIQTASIMQITLKLGITDYKISLLLPLRGT